MSDFAYGCKAGMIITIFILLIIAAGCPDLVGRYTAEVDNSYDKYRVYNEDNLPKDVN